MANTDDDQNQGFSKLQLKLQDQRDIIEGLEQTKQRLQDANKEQGKALDNQTKEHATLKQAHQDLLLKLQTREHQVNNRNTTRKTSGGRKKTTSGKSPRSRTPTPKANSNCKRWRWS
ncbi:MAG: hypothetical protein HZT40_20660 [Candidatus Thiothrix singaporensis]|uniref:Uncharacterized protein n=1 Tax=Candidatus Thiothrix singaporensis TaxID=2799669 RepID=A0A7L6AX85_9GAMM|nr:MAG: hypothetical protein HZT40_20660 [Candidatus Thiothrix singaporensis]